MKAVVWHDVGDIRLEDIPEFRTPLSNSPRLPYAEPTCISWGNDAGMKPGTVWLKTELRPLAAE